MITYAYIKDNSINKVEYDFVDGARVRIVGDEFSYYDVYFYDRKTKQLFSKSRIKNNEWCKCTITFFADWEIIILKDEKLWASKEFDLQSKNVHIRLDSSALGDTLAWFPYIEKFRKLHNCNLFVSTFHNNLFEKSYENISFVPFHANIVNLYAKYDVGYFLKNSEIDLFRHPVDPKTIPLQKIAADILGLDYAEEKANLSFSVNNKNSDLIVFGPHATKQCKFWNYETGWKDLADYFLEKNYKVISISDNADGYFRNFLPNNIEHIQTVTIEEAVDYLVKAKLFIGLGSGLSWLSWTLGIPTVLISGFSYSYTEMQSCYRVIPPEDRCSGCFNRKTLNRGDWYWCPDHKGSTREFECTKSITPKMIIDKIEHLL